MGYEVTKDLETGNTLIDSQHRQLFRAVNQLMEACQAGQGRTKIETTARFLESYVRKHFGDEEALQRTSKYPGYAVHKRFHDGFVLQMDNVCQAIARDGGTLANLSILNNQIGILVNHIRTEDKKMAAHVKGAKG